jgi:transcriptional regulator with XRE-family HTH domain
MDSSQFGARVRKLREDRGWGREELAERVHKRGGKLGADAIKKLELGRTEQPHLRNVRALAAVFGMSIPELRGEVAEVHGIALNEIRALRDELDVAIREAKKLERERSKQSAGSARKG